MAINATQRTDLIKATVALFNAAPGSVYLSNFVPFAGNVKGLIEVLVQDPAFTSIYPTYQTSGEFAGKFIDTLVGSAAVDATKLANAKAWYAARLDAGETRAAIAYEIFNDLNNTPTNDATWGAVAQQFQNKAVVAEYYSVTKNGNATGLETLQSVVSSVTSTTDVSTDAAKDAVLAGTGAGTNVGQTFTLTEGVDNLVATNGNDTINGVTDGKTALTSIYVETFGGLDAVDGGAGNDTLVITNPDTTGTLTLGAAVAVKNVENLSLTNAGANPVTADVQKWLGLTAVTIDERAGEDVNFDSKGNVTSVSLKGGTSADLRDNGDGVTVKDTLATVAVESNTNLVQVHSDAVTAVSIKDSNNGWVTVDAAAGARALNVTLNNVTNYGGLEDSTATSVAITTAGKASVAELDTDVATAVTIAGDKNLTLRMYDTGDSAYNTSAVKTITSTNTASVTIETTLSNTTAFTGGAGKETITINNQNTKATVLGAGDDKVTAVGTTLGAEGTIDGGDGTDTIAFSAADAAALSALTPATTYEARISNFEKVGLGQVAGGAANAVNLANLDDISYVVSAGTAASSGTGERQTITFGAADANGGVLTVGGVNITIASNATAGAVSNAVAAQSAAIIAANPNIASVTSNGAGVVTVDYTTTSGPQAAITAVQNGSGVTFGVVTPTDGTTEVTEQQTITVGTAPAATGNFTVGGVTVSAVLGDTTAQLATKIQAALAASLPAGVASVSVAGSVVTATFTSAAGNASALVVGGAANATIFNTGGGGTAPAVGDNARAYVAPVAETQTFTVTAGSDATGGEILVAGARIALAANQTIDQVGAAIAASVGAIQAADSNVAGVAYNTANDTVTITYNSAAGNVGNIVVADNTTTGSAISVTDNVVVGVAGSAAGALEVNHMANAGTFELTAANAGATTIVMTDATGTADSLNLKLNGAANLAAGAVTVAGVETIAITTTDSSKDGADATDGLLHNPLAASTLALNAAAATTITVSGNHGVDFSGSTLTKVTSLDASGVVANVDPTGLTAAQLVTANGTAGAVTFTTVVTDKDVTIKTGNGADVINASSVGTAADSTNVATISTGAGDDLIWGGADNDVIDAGADRDVVSSSAGADAITLGSGNDVYALTNNTHSVLAKFDTISDFVANTYGQGTAGAATVAGATADVTKLTGDTITVSTLLDGFVNGIKVFVATNAADAQTFIQNTANATGAAANYTGFALDSTSNQLYMDFNQDGVIDSVVKLTGVTTITEAAFNTGL